MQGYMPYRGMEIKPFTLEKEDLKIKKV